MTTRPAGAAAGHAGAAVDARPHHWLVGDARADRAGRGTFSERLAEWARDHQLGPVVTLGEWLTYQPPRKGGKPSIPLTGPSSRRESKALPARHHAREALAPFVPHRLVAIAARL